MQMSQKMVSPFCNRPCFGISSRSLQICFLHAFRLEGVDWIGVTFNAWMASMVGTRKSFGEARREVAQNQPIPMPPVVMQSACAPFFEVGCNRTVISDLLG